MPRTKNPLILLLAIGSGVAAFALSLRMMSPAAPAIVVDQAQRAVMAMRDIKMGTIIRKDDIDLVAIPANANMKILYQDSSSVAGRVARRNIPKGETIKKVDILEEGDNLASLIPRGYRAMTIPATLPGNITEMLQIGNRVDVILTYEVSRGEINSLTLIENARVIGVQSPAGSSASGSRKLDITLSVTPEGAETLAFAMRRGTLNIAIRSMEEEGTEKFFTLKDLFFPGEKEKTVEVKNILNIDRPKLPKDVVEIIRGVRKEQFATDWQ